MNETRAYGLALVLVGLTLCAGLAAQPVPVTIPAPTGPLTVTVTLTAAEALLVHAVVAPPNTAIPIINGLPAYTTLVGAIEWQFCEVIRGWVEQGRRQRTDDYAAKMLALDPVDRAAIEAEIIKRTTLRTKRKQP